MCNINKMGAACLPSWYPYFSDWYFANINTEKQWLLWSCVSVETIEPAEVWTPPYSHLHCPTQIYRVGQIKILCATKSQGSLEYAHFSFSVSIVQGGMQYKEYWCTVSTAGAVAESSKLHLLASSTTVCLTQTVFSTPACQ